MLIIPPKTICGGLAACMRKSGLTVSIMTVSYCIFSIYSTQCAQVTLWLRPRQYMIFPLQAWDATSVSFIFTLSPSQGLSI